MNNGKVYSRMGVNRKIALFMPMIFLDFTYMVDFKKTLFLIPMFLLFFCQPKLGGKEVVPPKETEKSGKESLNESSLTTKAENWVGTYTGTIPCDHCEGITVWLTLRQNETFEFKTSYLGLNDARDEIFTGKFVWENGKSGISLQGLIGGYPGKFRLEGDQAWYLDEKGNFFEGENSKDYLLKKRW
jgi:hypothetical protein